MIKKLLTYAPVQILSALSLFALIAIQTRFLLPEEYGFLAVLMVIVEASRSVLVQWINNCLIRFYPSAEQDQQIQISATLVRWLIGNTLLSCFVIAALVALLSVFEWRVFFAVYAFFVAKVIYLFVIEYARVNQESGYYRRSVMTQAVLSIVMTVVLLSFIPALEMALLALVMSYSVAAVISLRAGEWHLRVATNTETKKALFSYGAPLMLSGLLGILAARSDRIFIANLTGLEQAGQYAAIANLLFGIMALVFMAIALPLYPELTKLTQDRTRLIAKHKVYSGFLIALSLPAYTGLCLLAPMLVGIFLGDAYGNVDLTTFYLVAAAALLFNLRAHFFDHGLQFTLKTKYVPLIMAFVLLVQVLAAFALIPQFGALGAAIGIVIAMFVGLLLTAWIGWKAGYHYPVPKALLRTMIATAVMALAILQAKQYIELDSSVLTLALLVMTALVAYGLTHLLLNSFQIRTSLLKLRGRQRAV
ncbi:MULTISPECIES: oligosaccharide flippase family protein [Vibrio]|uniref:oligosaccharide flippase family protein n=1 Tax=Vibrio TaxID=662 RepID=UPI002075F22F|nr:MULTISPECIES: oligosaccharide flippase family protein [Vibrio]USD34508.1 polysaccharide biosynthesis protein [Vibrio sp. SCSIO 43186]USD47576.1 polysaccharide biosynthesis protein [Vibrio sp. SCSIO 43145]USD71633.1 polysaccharide biosynthesis protein [Vibrio sp. SCSIO 43139]USD98536.1 polysaccharide export protein [Vibrio coralliilyticus]